MSISDKIKKALASMEEVRRDLNAIDEDHAEAQAVRRILEWTQGELAETQRRLETSKAELVKAESDYASWQSVHAKVQAECNAQIDLLQQRLSVLEGQVKGRQAEHDAILQSMDALGRRLRAAG